MAINIYTVANHLETEKWKLISDTYKNLDTELEMECPQGHKQTLTYKQWRKHPAGLRHPAEQQYAQYRKRQDRDHRPEWSHPRPQTD